MQVINSLGQVVYEDNKTINKSFILDLTSLNNGVYYLKVVSHNETYLKNLIIQK